jgi:hypothetical protein
LSEEKKQPSGRRWWLLALGAAALVVGYHLEIYQAGPDARACLLGPDAWVLAEEFSPRYGNVDPGDLVVVRLRGEARRVTLARVLAREEDEVAWLRGQLYVQEQPVELAGEVVQPVRRLSEQTRRALIRGRQDFAPGRIADQWRGPMGERASGGGKNLDQPPAGLGLTQRQFRVPRQHIYLVTGSSQEEQGVIGRVAPLGDVVATAMIAWPRIQSGQEEQPQAR